MANFTQQQMAQINQALDQRYQSLLEEVRDELERAGEQTYVELFGRVTDVGDQSVADALVDMNAAIVDRQIQEIRDIEETRKRMKTAGFGVCSDCGGDIEFNRVLAYPTAKRCVRCQRQHEKVFAGEGRPTL
jgi:RNA polymerase-binding transcription factor DksA